MRDVRKNEKTSSSCWERKGDWNSQSDQKCISKCTTLSQLCYDSRRQQRVPLQCARNRNLSPPWAGEDWKNTTCLSPSLSVQFGWTCVHCSLRLHRRGTCCGQQPSAIPVNYLLLSLRWFNFNNITPSYKIKTLRYKHTHEPEAVLLQPPEQLIVLPMHYNQSTGLSKNRAFYDTYKNTPVTDNRWLLALKREGISCKRTDNHVLWAEVWLSFSTLLPLIPIR